MVDGFFFGESSSGVIREAMTRDLEFEPGTKFAYSNVGFTLLGKIIERASGVSFPTYLQQNLLAPLSLDSSTIRTENHQPQDNEARGHRWSEKQGRHVPDDVVSLPATPPDGGLITTLGDFQKWVALYTGRYPSVLSKSSIDMITTPHIRTGYGESAYGYGLFVDESRIAHPGYIVGFRSHFVLELDSQLLVVVFANNTFVDPSEVASRVRVSVTDSRDP